MSRPPHRSTNRRGFLIKTTGAAAMMAMGRVGIAHSPVGTFEVGEGIVDTTPPLQIEMGGFHRKPGNERRIQGIRQPTAARAMVLRHGSTLAAVVSVDIAALGCDFVCHTQDRISKATGIPSANIRLSATHTHSMPSFCFLRQWGAMAQDYMATVQAKIVQAVNLAKSDLAPASLRVGQSIAERANSNRTTKTWKNEQAFDQDSNDQQRWLDRTVHVMHFERDPAHGDLLWYHFSAHPVCYTDDQAGPDWPGLVAEQVRQRFALTASYLQGHAGDVNPGDGTLWIGKAEPTAQGVFDAICRAMEDAQPVAVDAIQLQTTTFPIPLDTSLFQQWINAYRTDPTKCASGTWVDAGFAQDWFEGNQHRSVDQVTRPIALSTIRLGELGLLFHPAELYSYYGLAIRRGSPLTHTVVVGYTDGMIGYVTDPTAYEASEYAAMTVPKILDIPPYTRDAARKMTEAALRLLGKEPANP